MRPKCTPSTSLSDTPSTAYRMRARTRDGPPSIWLHPMQLLDTPQMRYVTTAPLMERLANWPRRRLKMASDSSQSQDAHLAKRRSSDARLHLAITGADNRTYKAVP